MRKLIGSFFLALCASCAIVNASVSDLDTHGIYAGDFSESFGYVSAGFGPIIPVPNVGIGYRQRFAGQWGWDSALNFATAGVAHHASAQLLAHYYLSEKQNSVYIGTGARFGGFLSNHRNETAGVMSVDSVIGKALANDGDGNHFIEMHVCTPGYWSTKKVAKVCPSTSRKFSALPLVYITYGVGF